MSDREETAFDRWYGAHAEELNEERRRKYHSDPEYRRKAIERAREYRRRGPKYGPRTEYRLVNGKKQRVYRISHAAQMAGTNPTAIRRWEAAGVIPDVRDAPENGSDTIRFYTKKQVNLIAGVAEKMQGLHPTDERVDKVRAYVDKHWSV